MASRMRGAPKKPPRLKDKEAPPAPELIYGIDGEGQGRAPHRYTYLACVDSTGNDVHAVENREGLTTRECFDFLLSLPVDEVFGFSFTYDLTKIFIDLPPAKLWALLHEEGRQETMPNGHVRLLPIYWGDFKINYLNRKFSISRIRRNPSGGIDKRAKRGRTVVVWDVFRFFQGAFVNALEDWKIATAAELAEMRKMKSDRAHFDKADWSRVKRYCQSECMHLAQLVQALLSAHADAGLHLKDYFGVGSTASALFRLIGTKEHLQDAPEGMGTACASAFFGGRFEISRLGPVRGPVYNYDISSAYPYQITFLPCLSHGCWERAGKDGRLLSRIGAAGLACVRTSVSAPKGGNHFWGPLPWRAKDGTISFPLSSGGGWVWKEEFLAAQRHYPNVRAEEAWLYHTDCDCRPFARIPEFYRERIRLGKEAKGIVLKLAMNAVYGKLAQSKGSAPFNSWVWAGTITSNTRAMLLEAVMAAKNPEDVLMLATDGIFSRVPLDLPTPRDTGTFDTGKPLGGWEEKQITKGIFLIRPGIYFPIDPSPDELKSVRSRGIAKAMLLKFSKAITDSWRVNGWRTPVTVKGARFVGMKSGLSNRKGKAQRLPTYGEWVEWPIDVSFDPEPKRSGVLPDFSLPPWETKEGESTPYDPAIVSQEVQQIREFEERVLELPDPDLSAAYGDE